LPEHDIGGINYQDGLRSFARNIDDGRALRANQGQAIEAFDHNILVASAEDVELVGYGRVE
jgi:hypothetical protein